MTAASLMIAAAIVNNPRPNVAPNANLACFETCSPHSIGMGSKKTAMSSSTSRTPIDTYAAVVLPQCSP